MRPPFSRRVLRPQPPRPSRIAAVATTLSKARATVNRGTTLPQRRLRPAPPSWLHGPCRMSSPGGGGQGTGTGGKAIFSGGCFWGMQDLIRKRAGVLSTRVGYTGGDVPNATYRNHGTHAEAIEILFDPEQVSYRDLLELFFQIHDPTTLNR